MRVYVVVGVCQGVVNFVEGFLDPGQADLELEKVKGELNIVPGYEEESENNVQLRLLHLVEVDARAMSVIARRQVW